MSSDNCNSIMAKTTKFLKNFIYLFFMFIYNYTYIHDYKTKEVSPVSACTSSTELAKTGRQILPVEEHEPLTHLITECSKEKKGTNEATPSQKHLLQTTYHIAKNVKSTGFICHSSCCRKD